MSESPEITYAVHTATCTFLLDAEGFCRRIVVAPTSKRRDATRNASRCVGAQYVASLDANVTGMLTEMPRVGAAMLFARVDERGRISLVRTGVVTRFERSRAEDPFLKHGDESGSVETSAPVITLKAPRTTIPPMAYPSVNTDEIHSVESHEVHLLSDDSLDTTSEYEPHARHSGPPTLRQATVLPVEDEEDPYAALARQARKSEPVRRGGHGGVDSEAMTARVVGLYPDSRRRDR